MAWSEIKYALNSTLGTSNFKPLDTLLKNYISMGGNIKCIKKVQRGVVSVPNNTSEKTITISSINTEKAFLLLNGTYYTYNNASYASTDACSGKIVDSTRIRMYFGASSGSGSGTTFVPWQVIEFY